MNLKNCNVIYFKTDSLQHLLNHSLRGKIIVSDFQELNRICSIYGLIHVLNTNTQRVPEGVDVVICNKKNPDLEARIIRNNLGTPIIYNHMNQKWCGKCGKMSGLSGAIGKYCSEACMQKDAGFTTKGLPEAVKDLGMNNIVIKFDRSLSQTKRSNTKEEARRKSREKFQNSVVKEARRLEFAMKKESYKKEMRQPSHRKTKLSSKKKETSVVEVKYCQKIIEAKDGTKKKCKNKAADGSDYCRIKSHNPGS